MSDFDFGSRLNKRGIMPRPDGGYGGSRDFWEVEINCEATGCICNSGRGKCDVPSRAVIGKNGKCKGFQKR